MLLNVPQAQETTTIDKFTPKSDRKRDDLQMSNDVPYILLH